MKTNYTEEIRANITDAYSKGEAVRGLSVQYNVPRSTIYYWIKMNRVLKLKQGSQVTVREYFELLREIKKMEEENAILHECGCNSKSSNKDKLEAVSKLDGKYSIHSLCRALKILRSTYYHYKLRRPEQTEIEKRDLVLKPVLKELFEHTKGRIGSKKLSYLMEKKGYKTSPKRIRRLLDEMNLVCRARKKQMHYNFSNSSRLRKNLVKREFNPPAPNKIWVSDITYVRVNYKAYYICVIMDLFSRKVIGYNIADNQETPFVIEALKKAYDKRAPKKELIFHTDQGGQFTNSKFIYELKSRGIQSSFSRAGCPYDNAVVESFFRTFKQDEANHHYYKTADDLKASVDEFMDFYNNVRPHDNLGRLTPNEKEENYLKELKKRNA